jgi:competence protein ComEC
VKRHGRPLVVALLAFLAGLLLALRFPLPTLTPHALAVASFAVVALLASGRLPWLARGGNRESALPQILLLGIAGLVTGSLARTEALGDCRARLGEGHQIIISGRLGAPLRQPDPDARPVRLPLLDPRLSGEPGCGRQLSVRPPPGATAFGAGTPISFVGEWRRYDTRSSKWPKDPTHLGFLLADSASADIRGDGAAPLLAARGGVADRISTLYPDHLPLVEALVLGRRDYLDPALRDRFARAGLSHLLAISGMHVGLLAGALLLLGNVLRLPRRRAIQFTLGLVFVYLLVIGAPSSAALAGTMITLGLTAFLLQRPSAPMPIIAAAAFFILAIRPLAILDPGFQLSFAGVLGLLLLRQPLLALTPRKLLNLPGGTYLAEALAVGVAAFAATAPIAAHHFGLVAPVSILAGVPGVPLMALALVGTFAALAVNPFLPSLAGLLASGSALALDVLVWIVDRSANLPLGHGSVGAPPWLTWAVSGLVGLSLGRAIVHHGRRVAWILGIGSAIAVLLLWPLVPVGRGGTLDVHFIDVGQGDAIAIRTPGRRWILVDTGPASPEYDAGERRVVPFLDRWGARRLEALVLTHPDLDHIGGAGAVLRAFPVNVVFEPGLAVGKSSYLDLLGAVDGRGTAWRAARSGRSLELDGVRLDFLWPDPEAVDAAEDANQISAVVRLSYGEFSMLLTGDVGVAEERILVDRHGEGLRATVLKLGHHGSATSTADTLLVVTRPGLAVVSAGRRNRYGHPAPSVVSRVEARGIPIARTDREGTVSIRVERGGSSWHRQE